MEDELDEHDDSSREEDAEEEEMVRDMLLVFFCILWRLSGVSPC